MSNKNLTFPSFKIVSIRFAIIKHKSSYHFTPHERYRSLVRGGFCSTTGHHRFPPFPSSFLNETLTKPGRKPFCKNALRRYSSQSFLPTTERPFKSETLTPNPNANPSLRNSLRNPLRSSSVLDVETAADLLRF